jgi:hypothetical protein
MSSFVKMPEEYGRAIQLARELRMVRHFTAEDVLAWKQATLAIIGRAGGDYIRSRLSQQGIARRIFKVEPVANTEAASG